MTMDPVVTNPAHYTVVFENERVRVLDLCDGVGAAARRSELVLCELK